MRWVCALTVLGLAAASSQAAAPVKSKSSSAKPAQSGSAQSKTTPAKSKAASTGRASAHTAAARRTTRSSAAKRTRARSTPAPSYQLHPDPERYQEIQKALADRGYFKGEANGQWGDDSVDALKRYQADQKLENDGKITALTLTGLGLGPKHNGTAVIPVPSDATSLPPPVSEAPPGSAAVPSSRPPTIPQN